MMTEFYESVMQITKNIPRGKVATYTDIARALGKPKACRAVGTALRRNSNPIIIPCHRVVKSDGSVGKYSGKQDKAKLLVSEGVEVIGGKINLGIFRAIFKPKPANNN